MSVAMDGPRTTDAARTLRADLVERAAALRELLAGNADRTDRERVVPRANIDALAASGLLSLMRPARHGGSETDVRTLLEVSREVGRACGSTAWVTSLLNANAWFVGLFPAAAQEDVWGDAPDSLVAGVVTPSGTARRTEGGYRVSGRWAPRPGAPTPTGRSSGSPGRTPRARRTPSAACWRRRRS